jgi:hypothetical protein
VSATLIQRKVPQTPVAWGLNLYGEGRFAPNPHYRAADEMPRSGWRRSLLPLISVRGFVNARPSFGTSIGVSATIRMPRASKRCFERSPVTSRSTTALRSCWASPGRWQ